MLSYKHGYHAGNKSDVLKHICLLQAYKSMKLLYKSITYVILKIILKYMN